mmetsp:Transcript_58774/g.127131  ORF Transcript_58774/g.127131 Transcript_58774/m.127131 type:complete len:89 (-) Transcript_58774:424-690(-)
MWLNGIDTVAARMEEDRSAAMVLVSSEYFIAPGKQFTTFRLYGDTRRMPIMAKKLRATWHERPGPDSLPKGSTTSISDAEVLAALYCI